VLARHENEGSWYRQFKSFVDGWSSVGEDYLGDNPFDKFLYLEEAESWEDFVKWFRGMRGAWAYRGQSDANWALYPLINRRLRVRGEHENFNFYQQLDVRSYERDLMFRFQREAHQYCDHLPEECDLMSWLALMQHHGTPTRLLDWTASPYVAAYFALEDQTQKAAVWAIDLDWLEERGNIILQSQSRKRIPSDPLSRAAYINELLTAGPEEKEDDAPRMVVRVDPRKADPWMTSQRGLFLCKCWDAPSMNQLVMRMMIHPDLVSSPRIKKLEIGGDLRFDFIDQLKAANIHRGSLFPGLDGFARSLDLDLQVKMHRLSREMTDLAERFHSSDEAFLEDVET
jgi:hypothetical protein